MRFVIEFYRTRTADDAHALIGRQRAEATDLESAIGIARQLSRTRDMPQRPDAVSVSDSAGGVLYSGAFPCEGSLP